MFVWSPCTLGHSEERVSIDVSSQSFLALQLLFYKRHLKKHSCYDNERYVLKDCMIQMDRFLW